MKKTLLILLFLLILVAIPVTVFLVKQQQDIRQRAAEASRIYIDPATIQKNVDETFTVDVKLDTITNGIENFVWAADVTLKVNPEFLEALNIENGGFFPVEDSKLVDGEAGTAHISLLLTVGSTTGISGVGKTIAKASFKAKFPTGQTPQTIDFFETVVNSKEGGIFKNVLIGSEPAHVTIGSADASPSPSPSTSSSPQPSTTPGVSPSPSVSPTASPTQTTKITTPANGATVTSRRPVLSGVSFTNASMLLTINSTPVVSASFNANASGAWTHTPTQDLANGTYTLTVTGENTQGVQENAVSTFTVAVNAGGTDLATPKATPSVSPSSSTSKGGVATDSGVPVTGTTLPTILLLGLSLFILIFGGVSTFLYR